MKRVLLIGLVSLQFFVAIGQNDLRPGYIINLENDTIQGLVQYNSSKFQECIFFNGEENVTYNSKQINGYGYSNGKAFVSTIRENVFVEVLVLGKLSLYRDGDIYYVDKGEELYTLEETESIVEKDGTTYSKTNRKWFGVLSFLVSDCKVELPPKMKLSEKKLTNEIINYNSCSKTEYQEIKEGLKWTSANFGLRAGFTNTSFKFKDGLACFSMSSNQPICLIDYNSGSLIIGPTFNFSFPRNDSNLEAELSLLYSRFSVNRLYSEGQQFLRTEDHTTLDFNSISVPFAIKFFRKINKLDSYVSFGANFDLNLNPQSSFNKKVYTSISGPEQLSYEESNTDRLKVKNNSFGPLVGVGVRRRFSSFTWDLGLSYTAMSSHMSTPTIESILLMNRVVQLNGTKEINSTTHRFSMTLTISK